MPEYAKNFHIMRRAFIMLESGLIVSAPGSDVSHEQMLSDIGMPSVKIRSVLAFNPRGYFMNGEICLYQGCDMRPGTKWELTDAGIKLVQIYLSDLRRIFNLNDETPVYTGVIVGDIGTIWEKINKTTLKTLENRNIVM